MLLLPPCEGEWHATKSDDSFTVGNAMLRLVDGVQSVRIISSACASHSQGALRRVLCHQFAALHCAARLTGHHGWQWQHLHCSIVPWALLAPPPHLRYFASSRCLVSAHCAPNPISPPLQPGLRRYKEHLPLRYLHRLGRRITSFAGQLSGLTSTSIL